MVTPVGVPQNFANMVSMPRKKGCGAPIYNVNRELNSPIDYRENCEHAFFSHPAQYRES